MARTAQEEQKFQELSQRRQQQDSQNPFDVSRRQAAQVARGDPSRIGRPPRLSDLAVPAAAIAAPFLAPAGAGIAATAGLATLAGAGAEGFRQIATGESFKPQRPFNLAKIPGTGLPLLPPILDPRQPGTALTKIGAAGAASGVGEFAGRGILKGLGFLGKKVFSGLVDFMGNLSPGAAKIAMESPEVTKTGFASNELVETFIKKVVTGLDDVTTAIQTKYTAAIAKTQQLSGGQPLIPTEPFFATIDDLTKTLRLQQKGLRKVTEPTEKAVLKLIKQIKETIGTKKFISLQDAVDIRQSADALVKFTDTGIGAGLDAGAAKPLRQIADQGIKRFHPDFKFADTAFRAGLKTVNRSSQLFGLDDTIDPTALTPNMVKKVEDKLSGILKERASTKAQIQQLDTELTTVTNFLSDAQKFGAAKAFEKPFSGIGRFIIAGAGVAGLEASFGEGKTPGRALRTAAITAGLTSPLVLGGIIRAAPHVAALAVRTGLQVGGRAGTLAGEPSLLRARPSLSNIPRPDITKPFREPQETDPARIQETQRLSSKLGLTGQQELRRVPGTDLSRSLSGNTLVSTPKANVNIDAPLDDIFTIDRSKIATGRSRAIGQ